MGSKLIAFKSVFFKSLRSKIAAWSPSPGAARFVGEPIYRWAGRCSLGEEIQLSELRSVLVIRLDEIGDLVLMSPFLRELRRNLPQAWITLVVKPALFNLVEKCPYVEEILTFDWTSTKHATSWFRHWRALKLAQKYLWSHRFDLAILPRWDIDHYHGTMLAWFSGARRRLGWSANVNPWKQSIDAGLDQLLTDILDGRDPKHEALRNLDVLRYLGASIRDDALEAWITEEDESYASAILSGNGVHQDELLIAIGPGASLAGKRWPLARFVKLAAWAQTDLGARIIILGSREEEPMGRAMQGQLQKGIINLTGGTTLRQAIAVLRRCRLYIGNDSGVKHLAAAANTPVIEICRFSRDGDPLNPQSPSRFGSWGVPARILQPEQGLPPCTDGCRSEEAHCILMVTTEQVKNEVRNFLGQL
jgi:ADP-heptose:LPS heptosyltransferase